MTADFERAYARTNRYEGGVLSNLATDRGGETYAGISRLRHPRWGGWPIIDRTVRNHVPLAGIDKANLHDLHRKFFLDEFWTRSGCHLLSDQDIAEELYDTAVNVGDRRAVEWLQTALNTCNNRGQRWPDIHVDGITGPATASAVSKACADKRMKWLVLQVMETFQRAHYVRLAMVDPTQEANLHGWFRQRVQQLSPPP